MITQRNALRAGAVALAAAAAWACTSRAAGPSEDAVSVAAPGGGDLAFASAPAEPPSAAGESGAPGDVLVRVNGATVTRGEVDEKIETFVGAQLAMVPPEQRDQVRAQLSDKVLDEMIVKTLLSQAADQKKIAVSDEEVAASLREIGSKLPEGKTIADYLQHLGLSEAELSREIGEELRIEKLLEGQMASATEPSEAEVTRFYTENIDRFQLPERVRVRHVLIAVTPGDDDAAKAEKRTRAEKIRDRLTADGGESFAAVAKAESDCPSKAQGGELGEFARGEMAASFEEAAFARRPGEIGPVVETEFGFHVMQVEERHDAGTVELAEAKPMILEHLTGEKKQAAVQSYIDGLRSTAKIDYPEDAAA